MRTVLYVSVTMVVLCCLVASSFAPVVEARSNTQLMAIHGCDLSPRFDTNTKTPMLTGAWPNGRFGRNKTGAGNAGVTIGVDSSIMRWTDAPVPAAFYTIRSGDSSTVADPTTYTPGVMSEIHIRVTDIRRRFIGIVMYATNVTSPPANTIYSEKRVGSWKFPTEPNVGANFQLPDICGGNVVGHTDADIKPIHTRFFFTAPKGTGKIKFRVLLKQGEQNKGSFFYPMKELILNEAVPSTSAVTSQSVIGKAGVACADVCRLQTPSTPYCSKAALTAINSVDSLQSAVVGKATCRLPMLSGCEFSGVPTFNADGYCSFRAPQGNVATTCPAAFVGVSTATGPDVCYTAPVASSQAICVCTSNIALKGANPYKVAVVSSSSSSSTGSSNPTGSNGSTGSSGSNDPTDPTDPTDPSSSSGTEAPVNGGGPGSDGSGTGKMSSAHRSVTANGALVALLAGLVSMMFSGSKSSSSSSSRSFLISFSVVALVLALASPVAAHNYIKTQHRANTAAVSNPCQTRVGNQPHVQVIANQAFEIEWSVGHGDYAGNPFYFVTVPLAAYNKLKLDNITAIVNDYVKLAPTSAYRSNQSDAQMWEKHHLRLPKEQNGTDAAGNVQVPNYAGYFKEPGGLDPSNPLFYTRERAYMDKAHPSQYRPDSKGVMPTIIQTRFNTEFIKDDKRVSYKSLKYPWIESVDIFINPFKEHFVYNNQADMARFKIPAFNGAGDYVVWFYWAGYKDCVDVNVMDRTEEVTLRYGFNTTGLAPTVIKLDHCEFTYIPGIATTARKVSNVTRDITQCITEARNTGGVQVVRVNNPAGALDFPPNIPYVTYNYNYVDGVYDPCHAFSVSERLRLNCTRAQGGSLAPGYFKPALLPSDYLCFGVNPLRNQDNQVEEDYTIATDPQDPVFYSTCYLYVPVGGFLNITEVVWTPPSWSVADQCIDCAFHASLSSLPLNRTVDWSLGLRPKNAAGCPNCDLINSKLGLSALKPIMVGANQPNSP